MQKSRGIKPYKYERVSSELLKIIKEVVSYEITDPRVCGNCEVTDISVAKDYSHCKVYVDITASDKKRVLEGLKNASGFIRHAISDSLDLRKIPELGFYIDETKEKQLRIEELLKSIK